MNQQHAFISGEILDQNDARPVTIAVSGQREVFEGFMDLLAGMLALSGFEFEVHTWVNQDGLDSGLCSAILLTQCRVMNIAEVDDEFAD